MEMVLTKSTINIRNCIFGFKCTQKWNELDVTQNKGIRFCNDCQKEVHFIEDLVSLEEAIILNRCVAINAPSEKHGVAKEITLGMISSVDYDEAAF